ncbi:MAG: hypothetical protein WBB69_10555 [Anaerolineales bacterium]
MISIFKSRIAKLKRNTLLVAALITGTLITTVAYAQAGALSIFTKAGDPTELVADGNSQTTLMVDLSGCVWYPTAGAEDLLQVQFTTDLGTSLSPPSANGTKGEIGSPFEVTLRAGSQYGTAKVSATAFYCTEGNMMTFGQCSSKDEQNNPKCTGEFEIAIRPAGTGSEEEESAEESEESEELSVSIACPSKPKVGDSISCTASVSGAQKDESLEYLWSLDGISGSKTKDQTFTWKGKETGYYEVSVQVFGKDRDIRKDILVNVVESETSDEEEGVEESTSTDSSDTSSLISSLESFLKSAGVKNISPARLAVAGTGVSALIAIWMIINHRAGVPMEKLEQAVGRWRWREGEKLPETPSEVKKKSPEKTPQKPPEDLPEAVKSDKGANPPVTLPEQKGAEDGVQASAFAKFDEPTSPVPLPSTAKAVTGETAEQRLERFVDDSEDYRSAVDKTLSDFKKRIEDVPKEVKESEFWKNKVAPKLKKIDEMGIEGKSGKLKEFLRITKELLEVRRKINARLSYLSEKDRQGVIWLTRGLQAGQEGLQKVHQQLITDPAIAAAKALLPKEQAAAAEKFLNRHQTEIGEMLTGIKNLPAEIVDKGMRASQRTQDVQDVVDDVYKGIRHNKPTKFIEKGMNKINPAIKWFNEKGSALRKWIGRKGPVFLRDTTPSQE